MFKSHSPSSKNNKNINTNNNVGLDKFQRFENWLRENGAFFDLLELREYDTPTTDDDDDSVVLVHEEKKESEVTESEMRGVHSRADVPPDTICMMIPRKCLITVEMGKATPLGKTVLESDLDLDAPKHIYLMIYILWDRRVNGPNSFFHPYYEILPSTLKNMPIFWSSDELAGLDGSYLLEQIADRNEAIADDYYAICNVAPNLGDLCTLEEFKWARMCVCSRNFGLQIDGHRTSAMVPHADMLNHYRPRETKWTFEEDRQAFTITTLQGIPSGAQVYDSYGQKCNHRFLLNYGFAVEDNREIDGFCPNEVPIDLTVDPNDPLYGKKVEFCTCGKVLATALSDNTTTAGIFASKAATAAIVKRIRVCVSNNENSRLLFSLLRILACNEEELDAVTSVGGAGDVAVGRALFGLTTSAATDHHHSRIGGVGGGILPAFYRSCRDIRHPIGLRNERVAMMLLLEIITRSLAAYPTTLQEDVKDLSDKAAFPRFSNKRHAKIQVRGEKEVLHHFAQWARAAMDVMDVIERELNGDSIPSFEATIASFLTLSHDNDNVMNDIILLYCEEVLGSLRREEWKKSRRSNNRTTTTTGGKNTNNNTNSSSSGSSNNHHHPQIWC
mmetsp:Transcript_7023/g.7975  ORF Transcript_7023/g.7975 Transcript_7023/m.7975 type:complete len:615 (+) Transcript_7023:45-1889(+)